MSARRRVTLALALLPLLVAGCLRVGPGDDVHLVCEPKSRSPGPAYGPEDLLRLTEWDDGHLTSDEALAYLAAAQPHVITLGRAPHERFHGTLAPEGELWRFHADARTLDGTDDVYDVLLQPGAPPRAVSDDVQPPPSVVAAATGIVAGDDGAAAIRARNATLLGATWDAQTASCLTLAYAHAEGGAPERAVVNVVQGRVVLVR